MKKVSRKQFLESVKEDLRTEQPTAEQLFAFWSYDQFPYVLGGIVNKMDGEMVEPEGYVCCQFKAIKIISRVQGEELYEQILNLRVRRDEEIRCISARYDKELDKLAPWRKNK